MNKLLHSDLQKIIQSKSTDCLFFFIDICVDIIA